MEGTIKMRKFQVLVTSNSSTSSRFLSTSKPSKMRSFVPCRSLRAVATIGRSLVLSKCRVSSKPIPREAGVVRIHGKAIVRWI